MWSLPDLDRLNSEAATKRKPLEHAVRTGTLDGERNRISSGTGISTPITWRTRRMRSKSKAAMFSGLS